MLHRSAECKPKVYRYIREGSSCMAVFLVCLLSGAPAFGSAYEPDALSDFESLYHPGIPPSVSMEWSFPTGFSLGIDSGYKLRIGGEDAASGDSPSKLNTFPLSFSMKYNLYEGPLISQSVGVGVGPYFLHEGEMPIQLEDVDITGSSTCNTEWISRLSRDVYLNVKMVYTHAFQSMVNEIPLWDFTTWLGLNFRW
jgi:hypothetical protein